ncbi:MAG: SH3 domain-containing protein [Candidatus Yanofskybacteria bacterium]|nr:SH3 domain-containing protein [Candidatus Yanofskybacteria bacterium]
MPKINFSLLLVAVLAAGVFWVGVNQASAVGDAYFPQATTVALDVGNIVISAGSDADSVVTTNLTITITISSGQSMVLTSAGKLQLSNNGGYTFTCEVDQSRLSIVPSSTQTIIVTPTSTSCTSSAGGSTGSSGGGGGTTIPASTPTPTPTPTVSPAISPSVTPTPTPVSGSKPTPTSRGFVSLAAVSLKDGDVISAGGSSDPDVYIVNPHGYKRLFLNPAIFGFYGHLGGFSKVKATTSVTRDVFVTSGLFRNCETEDVKVYGVETTGEDTGMLHWVNTTGEQAVKDDPNFFKKVFCINTKEFSWYPKGSDYTSVNQIPDYTRKAASFSGTTVSTVNQYKVVSSVGFLNVRASATTASAVLGQLDAGDKVMSLGKSGLWHKITFEGKEGWVHGDYLEKM